MADSHPVCQRKPWRNAPLQSEQIRDDHAMAPYAYNLIRGNIIIWIVFIRFNSYSFTIKKRSGSTAAEEIYGDTLPFSFTDHSG
jgi:hypothetical protein